MAKFAGVESSVGIAIEFTPGTAKTATHYPQWMDFSMQAIAEKSLFKSARALRNIASNSMIRRKMAQGSISMIPNVANAPYFFLLTLGSISSATASGESIVYEHTIIPQNAGASMKTATMIWKDGGVQTNRATNVVCDNLTIECSDEYAKMTASLLSRYPDTTTLTPSFTKETEFAYHQMTLKFGTSLSNAAGQSATPVKDFKLDIKNNFKLDDAFLSGDNNLLAGGLVAGPLEITGSYTLHFSDTTELNKYKANTLNALIVSFLGSAIGSASFEEIKISLGQLVLTKEPVEYKIDQITVLKQEFTVTYDATDKEITVLVRNLTVGTTYAPAS